VRLLALVARAAANGNDDSDETQGSVKKLLKDHTLAAVQRKNKYGKSLRDGDGSVQFQ
jgi:hypothetical protein